MPTKWLGGFASGTVGGIRTRRYHGLLVAAATPPTNRFMLLNALEASVQTSHGVVDLSSHRYDGQIVHPDGYKTITSFTTDPWPTWRFALPDGSEIEQQIVMRHGAPTVGLSWKLLTPGRGPMTLRVRPLMCGRDFHALHHENPRFNFQPLRNGESLQWQPDDRTNMTAVCYRKGWNMSRMISINAWILVLLVAPTVTLAEGELTQLHQDFSADPGWEGSVNRVEAINPPTVKQDFGWSNGRIGGTIWQSTTPAWYGLPLDPPVTMNDPFTASGKIAILPRSGSRGVFYLGLFNHQRQGWRPWSTIAIRIVKGDAKANFYIDHTTGLWEAGAAETETEIPIDGSEHTWKFSYDPEARRDPWTDMTLYKSLNSERQTVDDILVKARKMEPKVTAADLETRLDKARSQGLVTYLPRWGKRFFVLKDDKVDLKGAVTVQIDNDPPVKTFLEAEMLKSPTVMDRFGIYNFQLYHGSAAFNIWDLTVNGKKVDLSTDPGWDGKGNRDTFVEQDFQRQNFGYSPDTNFAGGEKGEIGGQFYNVEPNDPLHGHYADEVGHVTLDDPLRFSGKIYFHEGATDAGMFFGYFRAQDQVRELPPNVSGGFTPGWPQPNVLGVVIDGPARVGWWFIPYCAASIREQHTDKTGHLFYPTRTPRTFEFVYDPKANGGIGQVTVTLDGEKPFTMNLTAEQRKTGATFDRFGLMSFRRGGKYSILYWDDLTYTARRSKDYQPVRHEQKITKVPYPPGGRKF